MATLYQYWNTDDTTYLAVMDNFWQGQSFTVVTSHLASSVKFKCWRVGSPGTVTVYVYAADGSGFPTGSVLATGTTSGDTLDLGTLASPIEGDWREITFTTGALLRAGIKYVYVVKAPSGDNPNNMFMWRQDSTQGYGTGTGITSSDSGATWTNYAGDLMFEDWGDAQGSGGGGSIYPSDAQTRVTSLIHRYDRGTYTLEIHLGEVVADFGLPEWESEPESAIPTAPLPFMIPGATDEAMIASLQQQIDRLRQVAALATTTPETREVLLEEARRLEAQIEAIRNL